MIDETRVLLLATHRSDYAHAQMYEEQRVIADKIQIGTFHGSFQLIPKAAVRISDLDAFLLKHRPHIVHFCAHGESDEGITMEDDFGNTKSIAVPDLMRVLTALRDDIRILFFNTCHSKGFAEAASKEIDYAIGIDGEIKSGSAMVFAGSFYRTLSFGRSVHDAFEAARGLAGSEAPLLRVRRDVDASEPFLMQRSVIGGLKSTLRRLADGTADKEDAPAIRRYVDDGRVILDELEDDAIEADDSTKTIDVQIRHGQLGVKLAPTAYQRVKEQLFPLPAGIAPPFTPFPFIGREGALEDVKRLLTRDAGSALQRVISVIRGWPGVGKTTLVGRIARDGDIEKAFPQGVLWTSLDQKPNLLSEMARWGRALGTDDLLRAPTLKDATAQLSALLRRRRMLLIVDDVWEAAHAVPFTEIVGEHCALLVTTRLTDVAEDLISAMTPENLTARQDKIYNLPVLTEEDSLKLLGILAPLIVEENQDECRELVRDLECLPLALRVAGMLLRSESKFGWGVSDLIREIREGARLIPAAAPIDRMEGGKIGTVGALLMKSTDVLDEFTRDCFAYLGAFAPKPATFDLEAMQAVWELDDAKPIVRKLVGHGLLEPAGAGRFQMHRILVEHAKSLCEE
jgi:hypothetical protein